MGKKWQTIKRLHFDIFQNVVLCQFTFHCNFRLCKLKHKIPELSEGNIWIFFFTKILSLYHKFGAKMS